MPIWPWMLLSWGGPFGPKILEQIKNESVFFFFSCRTSSIGERQPLKNTPVEYYYYITIHIFLTGNMKYDRYTLHLPLQKYFPGYYGVFMSVDIQVSRTSIENRNYRVSIWYPEQFGVVFFRFTSNRRSARAWTLWCCDVMLTRRSTLLITMPGDTFISYA